MAASINIEIDDAGAATVTVDGGEPQPFETAAEAGQYVADMLSGDSEMEPEEMWNEEAAKRAPMVGPMG